MVCLTASWPVDLRLQAMLTVSPAPLQCQHACSGVVLHKGGACENHA